MTDNAQSSQTRKPVTAQKPLLSHDLLHGLTPEEFNEQAKALARAEAMTPAVRARLKAQLIERLKTPVDRPSWGPDWVRQGERVAAPGRKGKGWFGFGRKKDDDAKEEAKPPPLNEDELDDAQTIARNMEKSRQVSHYKPLYLGAAVLALSILLVAMFVDYHIIREVWTRALANEFMEVPKSLESSVVFKSLQVIFAVLIVHFMLKITGAYGRNTLVAVAFVFAIVMIGGLGYLVAYNNLNGGTSTTLEQQNGTAPQTNSIDSLMASLGPARPQPAALTTPTVQTASAADGVSIGLPKISRQSLADADSWFWLAFASVVFFIVTTVAALYMQTTENNVRNYHIAHDYKHRQKQLAQLHLLELADQPGA
jgi:hypothetical protein